MPAAREVEIAAATLHDVFGKISLLLAQTSAPEVRAKYLAFVATVGEGATPIEEATFVSDSIRQVIQE